MTKEKSVIFKRDISSQLALAPKPEQSFTNTCQGAQRKRWEDNIRERTGLEFGKSLRAVENRGKWRKLVAKSSVVHQPLSRLRD